MTVNKGLTIF